MQSTTSRTGRKPRKAARGERLSLGLKVTPDIKNKLDAAAKANGRTQSQEAEARLEQTFQGENYLEQAMDLVYGPRLAALVAFLGRQMGQMDNHVRFKAADAGRPHDFTNTLAAFRCLFTYFSRSLDDFRSTDQAQENWNEFASRIMVEGSVGLLKHPEGADELMAWNELLRAKLGEPVVARLRDNLTVDTEKNQ